MKKLLKEFRLELVPASVLLLVSELFNNISPDNREHQELTNRLQRIADQQAEQAAASNKQKEEGWLLAGIGLGIFSAFTILLPVQPLAIALQGSVAGVILVKLNVLKAEEAVAED